MFQFISSFGFVIRRKNYHLYRRVVDNRFFNALLRFVFGGMLKPVQSRDEYTVFINPVFHGQFLSATSVAAYEQDLTDFFGKIVKPGMTVYDIGANVGVFSLFFAARAGAEGIVYAFEPEAVNIRCLNKSISVNNIKNICVVTACVSDKTGVLLFDHRGGAFSGKVLETDRVPNTHKVSCLPCVTVDDFVFSQRKRAPDIIKIDVEGHEWKVLNGMLRTLEKTSPIIVCELHQGLCDQLRDIYPLLNRFGYSCFDLKTFPSNIPGQPLHAGNFLSAHHFLAFTDKHPVCSRH